MILRLLRVQLARVQVYRVRNCCLSIIGHSPVLPSFKTRRDAGEGARILADSDQESA